jgi:uncharacterized protein (TIGR03435 family)
VRYILVRINSLSLVCWQLAGSLAVIGLISYVIPLLSEGRLQAENAAKPKFEVASIKPNVTGENQQRIQFGPARVTLTNDSLHTILKMAFNLLGNYEIVGSPKWASSERFDVIATASGPSTENELRKMLVSLLEERFKLRYHRDKQEMQIYGLVVAKNGPKFHQVQPDTAGQPSKVTLSFDPKRGIEWVVQNSSLADFARAFATSFDRPIVDMTGLSGFFSFRFPWSFDSNVTVNDEPPASVFTVVQEKLGLRLESRKGLIDVIVIDNLSPLEAD